MIKAKPITARAKTWDSLRLRYPGCYPAATNTKKRSVQKRLLQSAHAAMADARLRRHRIERVAHGAALAAAGQRRGAALAHRPRLPRPVLIDLPARPSLSNRRHSLSDGRPPASKRALPPRLTRASDLRGERMERTLAWAEAEVDGLMWT